VVSLVLIKSVQGTSSDADVELPGVGPIQVAINVLKTPVKPQCPVQEINFILK
jgi:hypothetical protein